MRVVAGSLKGRRLVAPAPGDLRVRPTADRAREALFSILRRWPQGPFLDLCAGTGAMGVEAHSRGYAPVCCVESGEPAWSLLTRNLAGLPVQALRGDALRLEAGGFRDQAVIFLDPPYERAEAFWDRLAGPCRTWIRTDGVLVVETARATVLAPRPGWVLEETRDYGAARFHLWIPG